MTEYYNIVPWFNSEEWHRVYIDIYSSESSFATQKDALELLLVWKARCPSLPSGVESTLTLLEVYVQDKKNINDSINHQLIRLAYSSAIMRFVNHMLDTEAAKGTSLYQAAKNLEVPDWIIDLRHDTAHGNNLPSVELLREACTIGLDWLKRHYWDKHKLFIKDFISGQKETDSNDENKIAALMNFCVSLSICANSKTRIKNLSEITDVDMRDSIISDARDLFGDQIDFSNLKTVSVVGLINMLNTQSKKLLKTRDITVHVNKALLSEDSLFLSLELLDYLSDSEFNNKDKLSKDYVLCFETLLTFLHTNNLILDFILELIKLSECSNDNTHRPKLAALWVSEILKALRRSKQFIGKIEKMNPDEISSKKRKELKSLFRHWFPTERWTTLLLLDLQKSIPQELSNISFVKPIISAYNANLIYFIRDILNLVEPHLPKETSDKICKLAKLISVSDNIQSVPSRIYTVDDLKKESEVMEDGNNSDVCVIEETVEYEDELPKDSIWRLASKEHSWASCPIGILPWQLPTNNILDMETEPAM